MCVCVCKERGTDTLTERQTKRYLHIDRWIMFAKQIDNDEYEMHIYFL